MVMSMLESCNIPYEVTRNGDYITFCMDEKNGPTLLSVERFFDLALLRLRHHYPSVTALETKLTLKSDLVDRSTKDHNVFVR